MAILLIVCLSDKSGLSVRWRVVLTFRNKPVAVPSTGIQKQNFCRKNTKAIYTIESGFSIILLRIFTKSNFFGINIETNNYFKSNFANDGVHVNLMLKGFHGNVSRDTVPPDSRQKAYKDTHNPDRSNPQKRLLTSG